MTTLVLQILLAILGLSATIFTWWVKRNSDRKALQDAKDKEIDSANNADDIMRASGGLR